MEKVMITSDYITLGQFLKLTSIISFGGEAKMFLAEHQVFVNDQEDHRRGRKLYPNDVVMCLNKKYQIYKK